MTTTRALLLAILAAATTAGAQPTPDFAEARRLVREGMARDSVPGLAVGVARGGTVLWEEGFGWADRERRVPATASTPFALASVTKTFVATAAMLLHERGRLDLDRPANDYLGAARLWSPAWDPAGATVRRLITHTSGLTTFDLHCAPERPHCTLPSVDETIRRYGVLVQPPGQGFDYSNLGYYVLGEIVTRAAGRDLGALLRDELFKPLGMTHASLGVDPALAGQTAVSYGWVRGAVPLDTSRAAPRSGASSGYAGVHDLLLFGGLHLKQHGSVLSGAAVDSMQRSVVPAGGRSQYGLGWWVEEDRYGYRSLLAQGGTDAAQAWLRLIPSEGIAVAVAANKGVGFAGDVVDAVIAGLLPRYADGWNAQRAQQAQTSSGAPAVVVLDSAVVGTWTGIVRTVDGDVPIALAVGDSGALSGTVGARAVNGRARLAGRQLRFTIPGDLEGDADSAHAQRQLRFYLAPHDGAYSGTVTTNPPRASGLDGPVSYWVSVTRRR
jgi:CubicO group peptidase (beta-lactamase class C family)